MASNIHRLLKLIDNKICAFLGINSKDSSFKPLAIVKKASKIYVMVSTEPYRRFYHKYSLSEFTNTYLKYLSPQSKEKLGKATGKAIAKNLVISFDTQKESRNKK